MRAFFPLLFLLLSLFFGPESSFDSFLIPHEGKMDQSRFSDLNGDGLEDLFLLNGKRVFIYFQKKDEGFTPSPDRTIELGPESLLFDLEEIPQKENQASKLLVLSGTGAVVYSLEEKEPVAKPLPFPTEMPFLKRFRLPHLIWRNLFLDMDGDRREDLILPQYDRFQIFYRLENGEFKSTAEEIHFSREVELLQGGPDLVRSLSHSWSLPAYYIGDFTGSGKRDLLLYQAGKAFLFSRNSDGKLSLHPAPVLDFSKNEDGNPLAGFTFYTRDINGDGVMDLLLTETNSGFLRIYLGPFPREENAEPHHEIHIKGWIQNFRVDDVNGDMLPDLLLFTSSKVGVLNALKILASKSLPVQAYLFLNRGESLFSKRPDVIREIEISLKFKTDPQKPLGIRGKPSHLISYDGDFNGDRFKDLLAKKDEKELSIFFGSPTGILAKSPSLNIEIPDTSLYQKVSLEVSDFNQDGFSDVALLYLGGEDESGKTCIFLSRREELKKKRNNNEE